MTRLLPKMFSVTIRNWAEGLHLSYLRRLVIESDVTESEHDKVIYSAELLA